jgi:hypothetical protein
MTNEKNKAPLSPAEEKLAEEELEQAAGGQIELVQDGPIKAAGISSTRVTVSAGAIRHDPSVKFLINVYGSRKRPDTHS